MTVVVDTRTLPVADRLQAVRSEADSRDVPMLIEPEDAAGGVRLRIEHWRPTPSMVLHATAGDTGCRFARTDAHFRDSAPERVLVAVSWSPDYRVQTSQTQRRFGHGEVFAVDQTRPFDSGWQGRGGAISLNIEWRTLGIAPDQVRSALPRIRHSPLAGLVGSHIHQLRIVGDDPVSGRAAILLANATGDLVTAMIKTVADDDALRAEGGHESLPALVVRFVEDHATDPDLGPPQIAARFHLSLRQLHYVWRTTGRATLSEWIVQQRLEHAHRLLRDPHTTSVAEAARRSGFVNASHFSRRFTARYGLTPREQFSFRRSGFPETLGPRLEQTSG